MTQAMHLILIIEDDAAIREVLQALLGSGGFRVIEAATAARGDVESRAHKPDLMLVDLGLPDGDGLTVIRSVRSWSPVPIIVLSARTMEEQKVAALDAGADDYMTKPFSAAELLARVRAALRRNVRTGDQPPLLGFGSIRVDLHRRDAEGPTGRGASNTTGISSTGMPGPAQRYDRHADSTNRRGLGSDPSGGQSRPEGMHPESALET